MAQAGRLQRGGADHDLALARLGAEGAGATRRRYDRTLPVNAVARCYRVAYWSARNLPGDERQQRQARDWVRRGFWLRDGLGSGAGSAWLHATGSLIAWCLRERAQAGRIGRSGKSLDGLNIPAARAVQEAGVEAAGPELLAACVCCS